MKALELLREMRNIENNYDHLISHRFDEAIKELEEFMKPKTCEGCEWWDFNSYGIFKKCFNGKGNCVSTESSFCCNRYEPKDKQ